MKKCTKCKVAKPFSEFYKAVDKKDGYRFHCKSCSKAYYQENRVEKLDKARTRNYGITREEYDQKIKEQDNSCEICKLPFVPHKNPCVDHNHTTLAVRGLLCTHCNSGLGHFKESLSIMQAAQKYLKKYSV
jgi:hypothetical protein